MCDKADLAPRFAVAGCADFTAGDDIGATFEEFKEKGLGKQTDERTPAC